MTDILLAIGVATFIVYTAVRIKSMLSVKRTSERITEILEHAEENLDSALQEIKSTFANIKDITGNAKEVSKDVRQIADTAAGIERSVRDLYLSIKESLGDATEANIAGLKAGIRTGVVTLVKNLREGGGDDHERGDRKERG